jgi:hypothetical protein
VRVRSAFGEIVVVVSCDHDAPMTENAHILTLANQLEARSALGNNNLMPAGAFGECVRRAASFRLYLFEVRTGIN